MRALASWTDKAVVITGASSGIGRALAVELASRGATLVVQGRDRQRLDRTVEEVGGDAHACALDLTDEGELLAFAAEVAAEHRAGGLAALVHSAGMVRLGTLEETDVVSLDAHYRLNVRAPFLLTQSLLGPLATARGQVVFVNSGAGLRANARWGAYAASKFALRALADSLRQEVAERGIRVTTVYPGRTATPMQASVHEQEGRPYDPGAFVRPEDVARQIAHLLELEPPSTVTELTIVPG